MSYLASSLRFEPEPACNLLMLLNQVHSCKNVIISVVCRRRKSQISQFPYAPSPRSDFYEEAKSGTSQRGNTLFLSLLIHIFIRAPNYIAN